MQSHELNNLSPPLSLSPATRIQEPITPNGIYINYVDVATTMLTQPELITTTNAVADLESERDFTLLLSTVSVTYTAHDCGALILLSGYYGNREDGNAVQIEQVLHHSQSL